MTAVWWLLFVALGIFGLGVLAAVVFAVADADDLGAGCMGTALVLCALLLVAAGMTWIWTVAL